MAEWKATPHKYEGGEKQFTPTADVLAGDVVFVGDTVGVASTNVSAGDLGVAYTSGLFRVSKSTSQVFLPGTRVFWDFANSVAVLTKTSGGNGQPFLGTVVLDAASTDGTAIIDLNCEGNAITDVFEDGGLVTSSTGTVTAVGDFAKLALTTAGSAQHAILYGVHGIDLDSDGGGILHARVNVVTEGDDAVVDMDFGLHSAPATLSTTFEAAGDRIEFHMDGASSNITAGSTDGTTTVASTTDTTVDDVAGTEMLLQIDLRTKSAPKLYIDGVQVLSATSFSLAAATSTLYPIVMVEKSGTNDSPGVIYVSDLRITGATN